MSYKNLVFYIVLFITIHGCCIDEPDNNTYFTKTYQNILDSSLVFKCDDIISDNYVKAIIGGQEACYYDGYDNNFLQFYIVNKYITSSPSTGGQISDARRGCILGIRPIKPIYRRHSISFQFPDFNIGVDPIVYLDSIFGIYEHQIIGVEDVKDDPNLDFVENALLKSTGGFLKKFKIDLIIPNDTIGNTFKISSIFGNQKGSYLRVKKAEKIIERDGVYYEIIFEFHCKLYHFPQYGKEGLWGTIENGLFVAKIKAE